MKQADLLLPAPLRWLTRAFSSIPMAVALLSLVVLYGMFASVPIAFIARGAIYGALIAVCFGVAMLMGYRIILGRWLTGVGPGVRVPVAALVVLAGAGLAALSCVTAADWSSRQSWFIEHRATVVYRLPRLEMTELEFYSWWPLKLILVLFVLNMIWATIRRIEFKFVNIGVLTVHTGIVVVAVGSLFYGAAKLEGDTILFRKDLGGTPVSEFYDGTRPAVYVTAGRKTVMLPLHGLPRYNDYPNPSRGNLDIRLHDSEEFRGVAGAQVRATIREFIAYGELESVWRDAAVAGDPARLNQTPNPALRLELGDEKKPGGQQDQLLIAAVPALRVVEQPTWAVELLANPDPRRIEDLRTPIQGDHGLIVEIPSKSFRGVYPIEQGSKIDLEGTGYSLEVERIGAYEMSFVTRGYEGARDTRALVKINTPDKDKPTLRRIVMHRFPERSQDFIPPAPGSPPDPRVGPMGKRTDPDPSIRLTYLDGSKVQYWLLADTSPEPKPLSILVRLPGHDPSLGPLPGDKFPLPPSEGDGGAMRWLHVTDRMARAVQVNEPVSTPKKQRNPKDEGTFLHALLPIDVEADLPTEDGQTRAWRKRIWLRHMRYPDMPDDEHRPEPVDIPGIGRVSFAFSRVSHSLPFSLALDDFEMQPYPGSEIPRDFIATLDVIEKIDGKEVHSRQQAKLNNPLVYQPANAPWHLRSVKLSQTGWDPGERSNPRREERNAQGRYTQQQRFTILGVGNNVGIRVIFVGSCLIALGIPWAFYVKPWLVKRQSEKLRREHAAGKQKPPAA